MNLIQHIIQLPTVDSAQDIDLSLFADMPFYIYAKDVSGKYLGMNQALARDLGLNKPEDFNGLEDFDMPFLSQKEAANLRINDEKIIKESRYHKFIEPVSIYDGTKINILSYKAPLLSSKKKILGLVGVSLIQDIREYHPLCLTERQIDCLVLLVKGMTFKEIAKELDLSPRTVEHYIFAIKTKFNCEARSELISKALKMEIIKSRL